LGQEPRVSRFSSFQAPSVAWPLRYGLAAFSTISAGNSG
jgi:hypothetical protein